MIEKILFDEASIRSGVERVAAEIQKRFQDEELTMLTVLRGGIICAADLLRRLDLAVRLDTVGVSSYRGGSTVPEPPQIISSPCLDLAGRAVLIVDDILDSLTVALPRRLRSGVPKARMNSRWGGSMPSNALSRKGAACH